MEDAQFEIADLESANCPLCSSENRRLVYTFEPFGVARCQNCQFYFLSPRLTEPRMLKFYAGAEYFGGGRAGYDNYEEQEKALRATFARLLSNLKKRGCSGGSLLDVGCGYGFFLEEAKNTFSQLVGTDFSENALKHATPRAHSLYLGGVDSLPQDARFDLITAIQVIEHVYNPHQFLESLKAHLKPGGRLLLATPHIDSFWHFFLRRRWPSFKQPEHVLYFDRKSLCALMKEHGLLNVQEIPYPHAFPITLIASKFGVTLPPWLARFNAWIPETTVAFMGENPR